METTKQNCREKISGVCSQCGGELEPIKTVDNAGNDTYWAGCGECMIFCWGVNKDNFDIARKMVVENDLRPYCHLDKPPEKENEKYERWIEKQTAGAVKIVRKVLELSNKENQPEGSGDNDRY